MTRAKTVRDLMNRRLFILESSNTVLDAAKLMKESGRGSIIVYEGAFPRGIFTERDFIRRVAALNLPYSTPLSSVISKPLITIRADEPIRDAVLKMVDHRIKRLPVEEDGKIVGIINVDNLIRYFARSETMLDKVRDFFNY